MALDYTVHRRLRQICSNKKNRRLAIHIEDAPEAFDLSRSKVQRH